MTKKLVYDLPLRLFHWSFVFLFLFSFIVAKTIDDEELLFSYHMLSGLLMSTLILWRVFWGLFGSTHSRFADLPLQPKKLMEYFKHVALRKSPHWVGHNPASSWAAVMMMMCGLILGLTGYLMTTGYKEDFEDIHELASHLFLALSVFHILGLSFHTFIHKDALPLSMISGRKLSETKSTEEIHPRYFASIMFLLYLSAISSLLYSQFDHTTKILNVFGIEMEMGD